MSGAHYTFLGNQDLNGILRGRSVPPARAALALAQGLPWVPANLTIGALNGLPPDNPFGPMGEIRLVPDPRASVTLDGHDGGPAFDLVLCDARQMDGTAWPVCPRTALKDTVAALREETGLTLRVAFEHEFTVHGLNQPTHVAFSLSAGRAVAPLADLVLGCLDRAGIALEQFLAEYGPDQFEIASVPADPLTAADHAVLTLETIRDRARALGLRASFLPKPALDQVGNGVHVHLSLWDGDAPVTAERDWLTPRAGAFVAGLIASAGSLIPFTCLSANSYARLRPRSWVGAYACVGVRNREAMVRLVPRHAEGDGANPDASIEFRAIDATANVYVALAAIIRAGLAGLNASRAMPRNVEGDPHDLGEAERDRLGIRPLPASIDSALTDAAARDGATWLGPELTEAYLCCRRNDARQAAALSFDDHAARLSLVY